MAKVYITEYSDLARDVPGMIIPVAFEPCVTTQIVAIGGSTVQSSAFNAVTKFVRLHSDAICSVAFGVNPVATTSTQRVAAGATEYFKVSPGHKIAVITNT